MSDTEQNPGADSIYRAPTSDTTVASGDNLLAAFVGPKNAHYYEQKFAGFEAGGGAASWNWPAFFVSWFWLMYRKMWAWSFAYWLGLPIVLTAASAAISAAVSPEAGGSFYYIAYVVVTFILVPMFANHLYYQHAQKKIAKVAATSLSAEQQGQEVARLGGTSNVVIIIIPVIVIIIGILAAIAIPAYQDYTIRAQVSEGLNISGQAKAAVVDSYRDAQVLPVDNATAGLPDATVLSGLYVASVEVSDGVVVVTYGNNAHALISGQTLVLEPDVSASDYVQWTCYSPDIAAKHLPSACR